MSKQVDEFLGLFVRLEKLAAKAAKRGDSRGVMDNVRDAAEHDPNFRRHQRDLKLLAKLRNFLVHERDARFGVPYMAEPLPELVQRLADIIQKIENPPQVVKHFNVSIHEFFPDDSMVKVLQFLAAQDFSQTFVRLEGSMKILTANTIQRWLGHNATEELIDCTESVSNVLAYQELQDELHFAKRSTTLAEALEYFDSERNPHLAALVITENGRNTEQPMALLTPSDLGSVARLLEGNS